MYSIQNSQVIIFTCNLIFISKMNISFAIFADDSSISEFYGHIFHSRSILIRNSPCHKLTSYLICAHKLVVLFLAGIILLTLFRKNIVHVSTRNSQYIQFQRICHFLMCCIFFEVLHPAVHLIIFEMDVLAWFLYTLNSATNCVIRY